MVACGSGDGVLQFFKWGDFGDICDRFPGHPGSIDSILTTDEPNVIITGSADSKIRIVELFDHKLRSVVGKHGELPIENLCWTFNRQAIISSSHDNTIKFWDLKGAVEIADEDDSESSEGEENESEELEEEEENSEEDNDSIDAGEEENSDEDDGSDMDQQLKKKQSIEKSKGTRKRPEKHSESDDESDEEDKPKKKSKTKKGMSASKFKYASAHASKSDFFSGL
jgi:hypothetical protein